MKQLTQEEAKNFKANITVKDIIAPKNNSTDVYRFVISHFDEKLGYGEVREEEIDQHSFFNPIVCLELDKADTTDKCSEIHTKMCEKYRKRRDEQCKQ